MTFSGLKKHHYRAILADPPWPFGKGRLGRERGYETMSPDEICNLPVHSLAHQDCLLYLWIRTRHLSLAMRTIEAWGFEYVTIAFVWIKLDKQKKPFFGIGYWTRNSAELCLLAKRGKPVREAANVQQTILSPIREHSRKPDEQYSRIEAISSGPYLELFARQTRPGWTSWGRELHKFERG